jgi:hypothetical protein
MALLALIIPAFPPMTDLSGHPPPTPAAAVPAAVGNLTSSGNFTSQEPGPSGTLTPGARLGYRYQAEFPEFVNGSPPVSVQFPPTNAFFPTTTGGLSVGIARRNLTFNDSSYTGAASTIALLTLTNVTVFHQPNTATLSTSGVALMSTSANESISIRVQWQWVIYDVDGSVSNATWSPTPAINVTPDLFVNLTTLEPRTILPGTRVSACLFGPVANRTYSMHAVELAPPSDFAQATVVGTPGNGSSLCWELTVPTGAPSGAAFIRIWDLTNPRASYLLYAVHIRIGNSSGGQSLVTTVTNVVNLGALGTIAALAVVCGYLAVVGRRRNRAPPPHPVS